MHTTTPPVWDRFGTLIPSRPYCTDNPRHGLLIRARKTALTFSHIQLNDPNRVRWLPFDVDRNDAFEAWERGSLPAPNVVAVNPANGHAHLAYALSSPVLSFANARQEPVRFVEAIERGLSRRLGADPAYTGLIAKNPVNDRWRSIWLAPNAYELRDLAGWLTQEDMRFRPRTAPDLGWIGRNVAVFNELRAIAYREVSGFKRDGASLSAFEDRLHAVATGLNQQFHSGLPYREVRGIAKSVAKWTWARFSPARFVAVQSARSEKAAEARTEKAGELRERIRALLEPRPTEAGLLPDMGGVTSTRNAGASRPIRVPSAEEIAEVLGVSRRTVFRHIAAIRGEVA